MERNGIHILNLYKTAAKLEEANEALKKIKGVDLKTIFNSTERKDYWFTAEQMEKIGLIDKVNKLEPAIKAEINSLFMASLSFNDSYIVENEIENKNKTTNIMTKAEFQAQNPELYAQIIGEGVSSERARVNAWLAFNKVNSEKAIAGVVEGKHCDAVVIAEFAAESMINGRKDDHKKDNNGKVETPEAKTPEQIAEAKADAFFAELENLL
jgi:hypothetical protein